MEISLVLAAAGRMFLSFLEIVGDVSLLFFRSVRAAFAYRWDIKELFGQMYFIANRSFLLVALVSIFTGMVMALQLSVGLSRFGLQTYIGQVVGLAIVRELGPVLTCLMLAARVGSGIAAEIGSMVVTEQVLAIEAMGANPIAKLVVPRTFALVVAAPLLTALADLIGIIGGMIITVRETGITTRFYIDQVRSMVFVEDFTSGLFKTFFFGLIVALVACNEGLKTRGGTEGVGRATTKTVVFSSILIFISDFFLTKLFIHL